MRYWPTLLSGLGVACVPIRRPGTGIPDEELVGTVNGPVATTGTVGQRRRNGAELILDQRSRKGGGRCTQYYDEGLGVEAVVVRSMTVDEGALIDGGATMGDEEYSAVDGGRVGPHKMGIYTEWLLMALASAVHRRTERCGTDLAFRRSVKKERNRIIRVDDFPIFFEKNTKPGSEAPTWVAEMACLKRRAAKELSIASCLFQVSLASVGDGADQKEKGHHSTVARGAYSDYGQTVDRAKIMWKPNAHFNVEKTRGASSRSRSECSTIELTAASVVAGYLASNAPVHG
ncbi:hypothetical protein EDB86DRAFT_2834684 [Lactarius hatsudake]|nr:hypothetical protein EDB86DRAFT_2834684 [Lactarius hatsudake]